jgi:ABC-type lipoprotein export system ATPase subunit
MIHIENISKIYSMDKKTIHALSEFSLNIEKGEFIAIQGPSGCGKTTLLLITGGLLHPDHGRVLINNEDIYNLSPERRTIFRAQNIGFVFQQYHLIPYLTVLENVQLPQLAQKNNIPENEIFELIESLGLKERLQHIPAELSAGEKQRTALARALLYNPRILLADEITGNLDQGNSEIVMNCLSDYSARGGTVMLVTHEKEENRLAHRTIYL